MLGVDLVPENWTQKWAEKQDFELQTSGSTGSPKTWKLQHELIRWSAKQTKKHFIRSNNLHQLIALPIVKAGGFMQWARAQTWQSPFDIIPPSSNPLLHYQGNARISSFTPMQLETILEQDTSRKTLVQFETILIGGAPISGELESRLLQLYPHIYWVHTFGMTETYSHFAGRTLGTPNYQVIDETDIQLIDQKLHLKNPCTKGKWLPTNDRVALIDANTFVWIGRSDFTINSGGIKIQLETVEKEIQQQTKWASADFFCWWEPDVVLGQKLVLITKNNLKVPEHWQLSSRFFQPKHLYQLTNFELAENGKILREETVKSIPTFSRK